MARLALKSGRVEAQPKRVIQLPDFVDECGVKHDAQLKGQFLDLLDHFTNGWDVPDDFYRLGIGKDRDLLLTLTGVNHLHLGGRCSDIMVYFIETKTEVIILRIAGHAYLEDNPRGSGLFEKLGLPYPTGKKA